VGREIAAMLGIEQRGLRGLRHRLFTLPPDGWEALKPEHLGRRDSARERVRWHVRVIAGERDSGGCA
jgi:hypothetical protein